MKIIKYFTKFNQQYLINLREFQLGEITISRTIDFPYEKGGAVKFTKAGINWPGCGGQSIEQTEKFSKALQLAFYLAGCLDNEMLPEENVEELFPLR